MKISKRALRLISDFEEASNTHYYISDAGTHPYEERKAFFQRERAETQLVAFISRLEKAAGRRQTGKYPAT